MKIQIELSGRFQRLSLKETTLQSISLNDLLQEVQAVATEYHRRTPQLLRQSFGLNFLPESVLINLCKQARGNIKESELYQIPSLQLLKPIKSQLNNQLINRYTYQFISASTSANLELASDDAQIPIFPGSISEQTGIYTITIEEPNYPGLDHDYLQEIWNNSINYWQNLPDIEKVKYALQSPDLNNFYINYLQNQSIKVKIWIAIQELSLELRSAITFLRFDEHQISNHLSNLSNSVRLLVEEYQSKYRYKSRILPQQLQAISQHNVINKLFITKNINRGVIQKIINDASQFLLISSYIIEDESITQLICEKSSQLPQGVWILTNLSNEILDRIDEQTSDNISIPEEYKITDERRKNCLRMLVNANIPIRSGAFHLKTYICEKYGYLGSCNLTRGSLDFNKEAGIVFSNNTEHQSLITLFQQFWQKSSKDEVIPNSNSDGFILRSLVDKHQNNVPDNYINYPNFLTATQYERDLIENLRNFQGEVKIYSRSFQSSPEISSYLRLLNPRIFISPQMSVRNQNFVVHKIDNLHAKITILGRKIAYIGGINFNFLHSYRFNNLPLHDLMYKTTNTREINQIINQLNSLH